MKTAVFGATGKTGGLVVDVVLARGWTCRVLVRNRGKLTRAGELQVLESDVRSLNAVKQTIEGMDAVFICLGMADISKPATDFSDGVKTIIQAMRDYSIKRVIAIASAGVLDHPSGGYRNKEGLPEHLKNVALEHVRNFEALRDSGLDWTLMCPTFLKEDIPPGRVQYAFDDLPPGSYETGYADLARTMVALVGDGESIRRRVGIVSFR